MRATVQVRTGAEKTKLLRAIAVQGAAEPLVRSVATKIASSVSPWRHRERLSRLHRFASSLPYFREPVEMFHGPTHVLLHGGDCDDHAIASLALAWALKYPAQAWPYQVRDGWPGHYLLRVGYPEAETPDGDSGTAWLWWESTLPASRARGLGPHTEELLRDTPPDPAKSDGACSCCNGSL